MGRYWIKVDGTDIKPALQESKKGEWNGDIDLGDGHVQALRAEYDRRKKLTEDMCRPGTCSEEILSRLIDDLTSDIPFLNSGLRNATELYQKKFSNPATPSETLKQLNWEVVEFNLLLGQAQQLLLCLEQQIPQLQPGLNKEAKEHAINNLAQKKIIFQSFLTNLFKKKRQPAADHILVFMLSDERRKQKPYAIPVWYIPYHTLKDQFVRDFTVLLKQEMAQFGLKAIGMIFSAGQLKLENMFL